MVIIVSSVPWRCGIWRHSISCHDINTLRPRQNGRHLPDDIFKWIFLNENVWILINISQKFVPRGPINNITAFVQVMAWHRPGNKPISEPMMARLPTHICVTQPQWVNTVIPKYPWPCRLRINPSLAKRTLLGQVLPIHVIVHVTVHVVMCWPATLPEAPRHCWTIKNKSILTTSMDGKSFAIIVNYAITTIFF